MISKCPHCQNEFNVPGEFEGKKIKCLKCSQTFVFKVEITSEAENLEPLAYKGMYYRRVISDRLKNLLILNGELYWLYNLVKGRQDLDFLIGANSFMEWISVCRGTTRILQISFQGNLLRISADSKYINLAKTNNLDIYGDKNISNLSFEHDFAQFVQLFSSLPKDYHYNNKKEGYFQSLFSRQFGILNDGTEDFILVDKEVVIGYQSNQAKEMYLRNTKPKFMSLYNHLSAVNSKRFGSNLNKKSLGNEMDFLSLNKNGDILLVEFKHGSSTNGVYLSPIQIGHYYEILQHYINSYRRDFINDIGDMIKQKKEMGLIPSNFPEVMLSGCIIPMLVIAEYNPKSSALNKLKEVMGICRKQLSDNNFLSNLEVYEYNEDQNLKPIRY